MLDETPNMIGIPGEMEEHGRAGGARARDSSDDGRGNEQEGTFWRRPTNLGPRTGSFPSFSVRPSIRGRTRTQSSFCRSAGPTFAGLKDHLLLPSSAAPAGSQITRDHRSADKSSVPLRCKMPASRDGTEVGTPFATREIIILRLNFDEGERRF